jgi:hypothetical protein
VFHSRENQGQSNAHNRIRSRGHGARPEGIKVSSARSGSFPRLLSVICTQVDRFATRPEDRGSQAVRPGNRAGSCDGGDDVQQEFVNTASGDALRGPSLPGAGAKQEPRLFRDLPVLLSTAADGPVMCRGFSISAGQQIV